MVEGLDFLRLVYRFKSIRGGKKGFCGLNISEQFCLMLIKDRRDKGEDINLSDISRELNVSKPAVSQIVNKLEWKRIIKRVRNKQDKKIINLELMPRTRLLLDKHENKHLELLKVISDEMGEELDQFMLISQKILSIVKDYYANKDDSNEIEA